MTKKILLGAHMSIRGGVHMAIERACSIDCRAIQVFVKNNMQWFARPLTREEIRAFLNHRQRGELLLRPIHVLRAGQTQCRNDFCHTVTGFERPVGRGDCSERLRRGDERFRREAGVGDKG